MKVAGDLSLSGAMETLKRKLWPAFPGGTKRKVEGFLTLPSSGESQ